MLVVLVFDKGLKRVFINKNNICYWLRGNDKYKVSFGFYCKLMYVYGLIFLYCV